MSQAHHRKVVKMQLLKAVTLSRTKGNIIRLINTIEENLQLITRVIRRCSIIRVLNIKTNKLYHHLHIYLKVLMVQATP